MTTKATRKTDTRKTATPKPEEATPGFRIIKTGTCPSLSGGSTLTYDVGYDTEIHFRVRGNSGGGLHGQGWVAWSVIKPALETGKVTAGTLRTLFRGKSRNTPGFLLVVLKAEGLVEPREEQGHTKADPKSFLAGMEVLIASGTDLQVPERKVPKPAPKPAGKAAR